MSTWNLLTEKNKDVMNYSIAAIMELYLTDEDFTLPLFFKLDSWPVSSSDIYHNVIGGEEYRLDLISLKYYGMVNYWWVILLANNIDDPFDIEIDTVLRIPSKSTIISKWLK